MPALHHKCLVCDHEQLRSLKGYEKDHLVKCGRCGFVFCQPIPTLQELEAYYEGYERQELYLSPITIKRYQELLEAFEPYRQTGKILDIGCGSGFFLDEAKKRGWEVYGTEFTDEAISVCAAKGILMQKGVLDPGHYKAGSFDVITSFEVIEHINNPQEEVTNIHTLLRKGGLFYVTTPNFNAFNRYYLKGQYNVIAYPEHLSYYTASTITRLFKTHGFQRNKVMTTGISLTRIKTSMGQSDQALISKTSDDEKLRASIEGNLLLQWGKKVANWWLTVFGLGMTVKGWFVKK